LTFLLQVIVLKLFTIKNLLFFSDTYLRSPKKRNGFAIYKYYNFIFIIIRDEQPPEQLDTAFSEPTHSTVSGIVLLFLNNGVL